METEILQEGVVSKPPLAGHRGTPVSAEGHTVSHCGGQGPWGPPAGPPPSVAGLRIRRDNANGGQQPGERAGSRFSRSTCCPGPCRLLMPSPGSLWGSTVFPNVSPVYLALWGGPSGPPRCLGRGRWLHPGLQGHGTTSSLWGDPPLPTERSRGPGLAPCAQGWRPVAPRASGGCHLRGSGRGLVRERCWPACRPSRAAALVRSSSAVGKPRPAWVPINSHEEQGVGPVLLLDAGS